MCERERERERERVRERERERERTHLYRPTGYFKTLSNIECMNAPSPDMLEC